MDAYSLIAQHYGQRRAGRSGVPLIQHIDEGLRVMDSLGAAESAKQAFALHPLVQSDEALGLFLPQLRAQTASVPPAVMLLAMEYRARANGYLSQHTCSADCYPTPGVLPCVRDMLIADKVQNYKDFRLHHAATHPRAARLDEYFHEWFEALGIGAEQLSELLAIIGGSN